MIEEIYRAFLSCDQNITSDTRKISPNCIFFALKGPNFNGNNFVSEALNKGASYAVIDDESAEIKHKTFLVEDVLTTLQDLANYHRNQFNIPVIGITGTNGKTTTKELLGEVLNAKYETLVTEGNFNNHIGVPLTLLKLRSNHEMAVIEMGASKIGDIKELVEIANPNYGIITNIGKAHLEGFGSAENIRKTKLELYDYIKTNGGTIIYNCDDPILKNEIPNQNKHFTYGDKSNFVSGSVKDFHPTIEVSIHFKNDTKHIKTSLLGDFNLYNILCAAAVGKVFQISSNDISQSLASYTPSNHRSQLIKTANNTIIADCYNANPTSTLAALKSLCAMKNENKMAILGDMLELGEKEHIEHQKIVDYIHENNLKGILVGPLFNNTKTNFHKFRDTEELVNSIDKMNLTDHVILLKGSRGIKLEQIINLNLL